MKHGVDPGFRAALRRGALSRLRGDDDHLHPGQSLEGVAPVLGLYFRALSGHNVALLPYGNPEDPEQYPDTHTTIRLPARVARFSRGRGNFAWYKVALTHRAAHYEGGTFEFSFARPARQFPRLRPPADLIERHEQESDLETFFRLFAQRQLAVAIFTVLEDLRLDEWAKRRYPGLRSDFEMVQRDAAQERPAFPDLRPRNALAEAMVRFSLEPAPSAVELPELLHEPLRELVRLMRPLRSADATVEDSAEAAMRAYCLTARLPNLEADYGPATPVTLQPPPVPMEYPTLWPEPERAHLEGDEVLATTIAPVAYRDRLGSRYTLYRPAGPLDQQAIFRFTAAGKAAPQSAAATPNGDDAERPQPPPEPMEHDHHDHFGEDPQHREPGELHSHETSSFVYSEWDHVANAYRRNWCCVRESRMDPAPSARFFDETLRAYGRLVPEIRRQIERLSHDGLRKLRRVSHGDELDLDAAIEALVDLRLGLGPSELVYVSRRKTVRDVGVAFLLDLSSSTAEHVESPAHTRGGDTLVLVPGCRLHGKNYRTILDLEKEAMALLMAALEHIGDAYGIYGFSGTGREDVKFLVVKDLDERLSDRVASRLDGVKPVHTTRMGSAIRHAIRKLRGHEARTKLLMLISDGRPFDLDYGQQYGENAEVAYAIHDTRQALDEARELGIAPFVLTIDPQGNDYLRALCDGLEYEALQDIAQLPARLLKLYHSLTF